MEPQLAQENFAPGASLDFHYIDKGLSEYLFSEEEIYCGHPHLPMYHAFTVW